MTQTGTTTRQFGRVLRLKQLFRDHPILGPISGAAGFVLGAVASTVIGSVVENQMNSEAVEAARIQQEKITEGAAMVQTGVTNLQATLENLAKSQDPADFQAFQRQAQELVSDLTGVVPVIERAALSNADMVARMRAAALSRPDGATTTAALELPPYGSATICRDFTIGIHPTGTNQVSISVSRRGEKETDPDARSGDTVALRQPDASASATVAGFGRGANGDLIGIDYNCFEGTG